MKFSIAAVVLFIALAVDAMPPPNFDSSELPAVSRRREESHMSMKDEPHMAMKLKSSKRLFDDGDSSERYGYGDSKVAHMRFGDDSSIHNHQRPSMTRERPHNDDSEVSGVFWHIPGEQNEEGARSPSDVRPSPYRHDSSARSRQRSSMARERPHNDDSEARSIIWPRPGVENEESAGSASDVGQMPYGDESQARSHQRPSLARSRSGESNAEGAGYSGSEGFGRDFADDQGYTGGRGYTSGQGMTSRQRSGESGEALSGRKLKLLNDEEVRHHSSGFGFSREEDSFRRKQNDEAASRASGELEFLQVQKKYHDTDPQAAGNGLQKKVTFSKSLRGSGSDSEDPASYRYHDEAAEGSSESKMEDPTSYRYGDRPSSEEMSVNKIRKGEERSM